MNKTENRKKAVFQPLPRTALCALLVFLIILTGVFLGRGYTKIRDAKEENALLAEEADLAQRQAEEALDRSSSPTEEDLLNAAHENDWVLPEEQVFQDAAAH